jgi:hypothetical protein
MELSSGLFRIEEYNLGKTPFFLQPKIIYNIYPKLGI